MGDSNKVVKLNSRPFPVHEELSTSESYSLARQSISPTMSRFFRRGGDDSSSDSSSDEEELYSDNEEQQDFQQGGSDQEDDSDFPSDDSDDSSSDDDGQGFRKFLKDASSDSEDSDDEARAKVRSAKTKFTDELEGSIKQIENGEKNGDWTLISTGKRIYVGSWR